MMERKIEIFSPATGNVIALKDVPDEVFSTGLMGQGLAVQLDGSDWTICAPLDAECSAIFPTGHAVALRHECGLEMLIHVGVDTFREEGAFEKKVVEKQRVVQGQPLLHIEKACFPADFPLVIFTLLNGKEFTVVTKFKEKVVANKTVLFVLTKEM
jgi:glucose-specific phosphotransferase system IIA component